MSRLAACVFSVLLLVSCAPASQSEPAATSAPEEVRSDLAPSGTLRAGINYNNPLLARRDPATEELSGLAVDLSRELGRRIGVPVELVPFDSAGRMSEAVKSGAWDIAYLAIDPARAADIEFTDAYLELEGTYLVPAGSPLRTVEDVDREGVRIAVTAGSAYDLFLSRNLKQAQLVRANTTPESVDLFVAQNLDAVAAVRTALVTGSQRVAGSQVMDGAFMTIPQAAGVPKGREAAARYVHEFIESVKASGFVAEALQRYGLEAEATVAPPAAGR